MRTVMRLDGVTLSGRTYSCHPSVQIVLIDNYEASGSGQVRSGSTETMSVLLYEKPDFKQFDIVEFRDNQYIAMELYKRRDGYVLKLKRDYV
jgi:hypothetical protein